MTYRILMAEDDTLAARALKTLIEQAQDFDVVHIAKSAQEAISMFQTLAPDLALFDIRLGDSNGIDAAEHILKGHPATPIILLSTFEDEAFIQRALRIGVKGYLLKQNYDGIIPALRAVIAGQTVYGATLLAKAPSALSSSKRTSEHTLRTAGLTDREIEISQLVSKGFNNKEIASALFLSEGTVRNLLSGILDKLQLRDRTQLAIFILEGRE